MYIILKPVSNFTLTCQINRQSQTRSTTDILSLRHLRNKITEDNGPTVVIDHGQTAMLALLNGVRSTPTIATPMPAGFKNDPLGGSYGNDNDYNAIDWNHLYHHKASLLPTDFRQETSHKVRLAVSKWVEDGDMSAVVQQGFYPTYIEKIKNYLSKRTEAMRLHELTCLSEERALDICMCGDTCSRGSALCPRCNIIIYEPHLIGKNPKATEETNNDC